MTHVQQAVRHAAVEREFEVFSAHRSPSEEEGPDGSTIKL